MTTTELELKLLSMELQLGMLQNEVITLRQKVARLENPNISLVELLKMRETV